MEATHTGTHTHTHTYIYIYIHLLQRIFSTARVYVQMCLVELKIFKLRGRYKQLHLSFFLSLSLYLSLLCSTKLHIQSSLSATLRHLFLRSLLPPKYTEFSPPLFSPPLLVTKTMWWPFSPLPALLTPAACTMTITAYAWKHVSDAAHTLIPRPKRTGFDMMHAVAKNIQNTPRKIFALRLAQYVSISSES